MPYPDGSICVYVLGILQIAGLASAWLARLTEGTSRQHAYQWLFFGFLGLIAAATMASAALDHVHWLTTGTTLGIMMLAAVWDVRATAPAERHVEHHQVPQYPYAA
jgi:hypothetical protein